MHIVLSQHLWLGQVFFASLVNKIYATIYILYCTTYGMNFFQKACFQYRYSAIRSIVIRLSITQAHMLRRKYIVHRQFQYCLRQITPYSSYLLFVFHLLVPSFSSVVVVSSKRTFRADFLGISSSAPSFSIKVNSCSGGGVDCSIALLLLSGS